MFSLYYESDKMVHFKKCMYETMRYAKYKEGDRE